MKIVKMEITTRFTTKKFLSKLFLTQNMILAKKKVVKNVVKKTCEGLSQHKYIDAKNINM